MDDGLATFQWILVDQVSHNLFEENEEMLLKKLKSEQLEITALMMIKINKIKIKAHNL